MPRPTRLIEFGKHVDPGYGEQWARVPRSVSEGYLRDGAQRRRDIKDQGERLHQSNIATLLQVIDWDLRWSHDDNAKMPVPRMVDDPHELDQLVRDVPMEIIGVIAMVINGTPPEKLKKLLEQTEEEAKEEAKIDAAALERIENF